ncbi:hypothetical protein Pint_28229 [Pistacia integerrima]|uniref:Uncharacterized protein n=1 Tax=Pistacia integerrima TaxID=434235 RepID=A0ACC0YTQ2_9ROSI|nr:hypothetical protein Pint_28229 [Pistacia integerrima]
MQIAKPHAAILASPGMGHLVPVLELGKRLVTLHKLQVTIFIVAPATSDEQLSQLLDSQNQDFLHIVLLPSVDVSGIADPEASISTKIVIMMHESLPLLRSAISAMTIRPTALIVDLFGTEAMAIADEFEMLKYVFIASNAWFFAVMAYAPELDRKVLAEHVYQKQPLKLPGCTPIRFEDNLEVFPAFENPMYDGFMHASMEMALADGIIINTWEDLEPKTLRALRDSNLLGRVCKAPVYPVGPLARSVQPPIWGKEVLDWLDKQPRESVIYVSFGSGGTLSAKQMVELASGLELSQQRFLWVVKELKLSGEKASIKGGSSYNSLSQLANSFQSFLQTLEVKAKGG